VRAEVARERRTPSGAPASGLSAPRAAAAAARAAVPSPASIYIDEAVLIAMAEAAAGVPAPRAKEATDGPGHQPPAPCSAAAASHREEHRQLVVGSRRGRGRGSRGCRQVQAGRLHALLLSAFRALHPRRRIVLCAFPFLALHRLLETVGLVSRGKVFRYEWNSAPRCSVKRGIPPSGEFPNENNGEVTVSGRGLERAAPGFIREPSTSLSWSRRARVRTSCAPAAAPPHCALFRARPARFVPRARACERLCDPSCPGAGQPP
jgi:hypothetical protein